MMRLFKASSVMLLILSLVLSIPVIAGAQTDNGMTVMLEAVRLKHGLPALAGAVVTSGGITSIAVTGVRKSGTDVPATLDDLWHLGSDTKAMTAVLIGTLVEEGSLGWGTSIGDVFPELIPGMSGEVAKITLLHLLSPPVPGFPANLPWTVLLRQRARPMEQRQAVVKDRSRLEAPVRTRRSVPLLEPWLCHRRRDGREGDREELGRTASRQGLRAARNDHDRLRRPWHPRCRGPSPGPHDDKGDPLPENGPEIDNPEVMGPAGTVHCSLADWARFITDTLRGLRGEKALLNAGDIPPSHNPALRRQLRPWLGGQ
jgi:Beta-lactamase class C and other penicillin binding proteins